jgi:hypothetical protein
MFNYTRSKFVPHRQLTLGLLFRQYTYWHRNTFISFLCTFLYLYISTLSATVSPSPPSLYPHLPRDLHLYHHLHLPPYRSEEILFKKEKRTEQCAVRSLY